MSNFQSGFAPITVAKSINGALHLEENYEEDYQEDFDYSSNFHHSGISLRHLNNNGNYDNLHLDSY
jgi:hypothetical protein